LTTRKRLELAPLFFAVDLVGFFLAVLIFRLVLVANAPPFALVVRLFGSLLFAVLEAIEIFGRFYYKRKCSAVDVKRNMLVLTRRFADCYPAAASMG
jgi:hypothetical protein